MLRHRDLRAGFLCGLALCIPIATSHAFSFAEDAEQDARAEEQQKAAAGTALMLSGACLDDLRRRKIMIVMGERSGDGISADQARFSPHYNSINKRLLKRGIRTYTQQEIRAQIAQAEVDAYFRNDPDAALAASRKIGADLVMRGTISARSSINPVARIPEVHVSIAFAFLTSDGKLLSDASASAESYSGSDTLGTAGMLIEEQADAVVNTLLSGYCTARPAAPGRKRK
ncbi:MAG TPA: hypothetical protein VIO81_12735 [Methyloversatilis sp.]